MPSFPRILSPTWIKNFCIYVKAHLNFYRLHILFFTFTPLICSAILYASNGEFPVSYVDALFNCVSAVTVCGLATVDLSGLTSWQQVLLFIQMSLGNPVVVSWVIVYIRRIFANRFQTFYEKEVANRIADKAHKPVEVRVIPWWKRALEIIFHRERFSGEDETSATDDSSTQDDHHGRRLRTDMIRRMDDAPKLINPSGWISERTEPDIRNPIPLEDDNRTHDSSVTSNGEEAHRPHLTSIISNNGRMSPASELGSMHRYGMVENGPETKRLDRTTTVEFDLPHASRVRETPADGVHRERRHSEIGGRGMEERIQTQDRRSMRRPTMSLQRTMTMQTHQTHHLPKRTKHSGFGGFPMPHEILKSVFHHFFPKLEHKLTRTLTMPRTRTIASQHGTAPPGADRVTYISFEAVVGRNSAFHSLTEAQLDELLGVEYRALTALLWIVGGYHIISQGVAFVVIAPYMSIKRWSTDFETPMLHRNLSPVWFSLFQVVSSYTNTGMSLEDYSMVPFQQAYPMIVFMIFLILAGNTAFPVFLRFTIWMLTKLVPRRSRAEETLHFLLDHPRRCFIYLFPSHQTWFLVTVILALNFTDWFFFLVLDLGTPAVTAIPVGVRVLIGFLQAVAVRAAGFGAVTLSALAPAVKVLYVLMMYVSVYPIAMSVRSTNVYEEKSLGVFEDDNDSLDEEAFSATGNRATVWSRYLTLHMRKQLSFDMWWLAVALFLVCIIERDALENTANQGWFNIFNILFELVSAYGTVGLSVGLPNANYSFSGALRPLSKLILCLVMLRGRHRGLPVAIDRAVVLPFEFRQSQDQGSEHQPESHFGMASRRSLHGSARTADVGMREKSPTRGSDRLNMRHAPTRTISRDRASDIQYRTSRFVDDEIHDQTT